MNFKFKKDKTLEERKQEYERIQAEYPGKIPIVCEKAPKSPIRSLIKTKYLVDHKVKLIQFLQTIKNGLELDEKEAIFLLVNGKTSLTQNADTIGEIHKRYKDEDGFLYFAYASEEIWG